MPSHGNGILIVSHRLALRRAYATLSQYYSSASCSITKRIEAVNTLASGTATFYSAALLRPAACDCRERRAGRRKLEVRTSAVHQACLAYQL